MGYSGESKESCLSGIKSFEKSVKKLTIKHERIKKMKNDLLLFFASIEEDTVQSIERVQEVLKDWKKELKDLS